MEKDAGFHISSRLTGSDLKSESLMCYLTIYNIRWMSRPQNWSKMIQNTVLTAHKDTMNRSAKNCISQTASVNGLCARQRRVVPLGQV